MSFLVSGRVRLTATIDDGSVITVGTLEAGSFLGQTALPRQPVLAGAYALDEVTAVQIERQHTEHLVPHRPLLLQELGRVNQERRSKVQRALAAVGR
jgi:CRP-like cAMP-binding protein